MLIKLTHNYAFNHPEFSVSLHAFNQIYIYEKWNFTPFNTRFNMFVIKETKGEKNGLGILNTPFECHMVRAFVEQKCYNKIT